eukprot:6194815-Pleurochrysis_carterae.AAC.2
MPFLPHIHRVPIKPGPRLCIGASMGSQDCLAKALVVCRFPGNSVILVTGDNFGEHRRPHRPSLDPIARQY